MALAGYLGTDGWKPNHTLLSSAIPAIPAIVATAYHWYESHQPVHGHTDAHIV